MPLTAEEDQFVNNLKVPSPSITEQETRGQSNNPIWLQIKRYRLTSRKLNSSQTKLVQNTILTQNDLSSVSAVKYGLSNESRAEQYAEYMKASGNPVQVSDCGVVISNAMPWLAASPDRKIIDKVFGFGLVEIKCPFTLRNVAPEEACADPNFYCHLVNGKPELKKDHPYHYQVQGQVGVSGLKWCDFVVFFQKGLVIQHIKFDELFCISMIEKVTKYCQHM